MALGNLQSVIEKLRKTIEAHRGYLAENETRTRQVLIDPLLRKLGWDVSNPNIVQLEYEVRKERADYALMSKGKPLAVVEAKRLGSDLGDKQIRQALNYANPDAIRYIIVTDGDKWEMYKVFEEVKLEERLLMKLELSQQPADKNASQAWAMRKPNLTSKKPCFVPPKPAPDQSSRQPNKPPKKQPPDASSIDDDERYPFASNKRLYPQDTKPTKLKIGNNPEKTVNSWKVVIHEVAAWLADERRLSANDCPIGGRTYTFIGRKAEHPNGTQFTNPRRLSNGLILERDYVNTREQWRKLKQLLEDLDVNRNTIRVSYRSSRQANR